MRRSVRMILEDVLGEDVSGKEVEEVEHVFYGKIADANQLVELAKQPYVTKHLQEQAQTVLDIGSNNDGVRKVLRVRRVNRTECVMTRKIRTANDVGPKEASKEITPEDYEFMAATIGTAMAKMRYTIQPEGWERPLELDVFLDAHGHPLNGYAKFDYEVTSEDQTPPPLPITLVDLVHLNPYKATDADAAQLREFMQMCTHQL